MNSLLLVVEVDDYHEIESLPRSIKGIKTESCEIGYASDGMYWGVVFTKDNKKTNEEFMVLCTENGFYMSAEHETWDDWVKLCHKHNIKVKFSQEELDDWEIDKTGAEIKKEEPAFKKFDVINIPSGFNGDKGPGRATFLKYDDDGDIVVRADDNKSLKHGLVFVKDEILALN